LSRRAQHDTIAASRLGIPIAPVLLQSNLTRKSYLTEEID